MILINSKPFLSYQIKACDVHFEGCLALLCLTHAVTVISGKYQAADTKVALAGVLLPAGSFAEALHVGLCAGDPWQKTSWSRKGRCL